jgi:hypothetical protein
MANYVCSSAQMTCSFGTTPSPLTVLPPRPLLSNKPMANIMDMAPMVNVASFGMCNSASNPQVIAATSAALGVFTPMPCIPCTATPWIPGKPNVMIAGLPALTDSCKLLCLWAGNISFVSHGQTSGSCQGT